MFQNKFVLIGIVLVVLMVAFGRNPVEEAKQDREAALRGRDPLVAAIEEHNAKGRNRTWRGMDFGAGGTSGAQSPSHTRGNMGAGGIYQPPANASMYPNRETNLAPPGTALPAPAPGAQQDYYPPPPLPEAQKPRQLRSLPPRSEMFIKMRNGQPVGFRGSEVYTVNADGETVPMPDGVYSLYEGTVEMHVRGGKQYTISN